MFKGILEFLFVVLLLAGVEAAGERPNILFLTVDDMSADSVGAFGCRLADTTPNIDRLADEGLRFNYAHVVVGNCMPSRNVMLSGRYPHNNRVEGFYPVKDKDYPVLCDLMKEAGYFTAIRGKVSHSTPYHPYEWDLVLDTQDGKRVQPKDVKSYYHSTKEGIAAAKETGKPFCLLVNVSDPHKPFYATGKKGEKIHDPHVPSRIFTADEVPVPGFLFDHPDVRIELAQYYSTVRRADDCVGETLKALEESGEADNTVVMFLSDHGMPLPFAKTAVWHHSTHTPLIVRWPGLVKAGAIDRKHMVSAVDLLPTLLDVVGSKHPAGIDGQSFAALLHGKKQGGRDHVIKEYNENSGAGRHPMRSVQGRRYCYIYNPWSNGERVFKTATTGTMSYRAMKAVAEENTEIAERLDLFDHRVPEEFYDVEKDPDCLHNLVRDASHRAELVRHRKILENWMLETGDHLLETFRKRKDEAFTESYMTKVQAEANERRKLRAKNNPKRQSGKLRLIRLNSPESIQVGVTVTLRIPYGIPQRLGKQSLHVTLKGEQKRLERKVVMISGKGTASVDFEIPNNVSGKRISFAAFVGKDYQSNLQHLTTKPVAVK